MPGDDVVFTGYWTFVPKITVTFELAGGVTSCEVNCECFASQMFLAGGTATEPESNPTREDFYFRGWATRVQAHPGDEFNFSTTIYDDKTLYAIWQPVAPVIDPINVGDAFVTGSGIPNATLRIYIPGVGDRNVQVDSNGRWRVLVWNADLPVGEYAVARNYVTGYVISERYTTPVLGPYARLEAWYDWAIICDVTGDNLSRGDITAGDSIEIFVIVANVSPTVAHNVILLMCMRSNFLCYNGLEDNIYGSLGNLRFSLGRLYGNGNGRYSEHFSFTLTATYDMAEGDVTERILNVFHTRTP